jgi:uncharacterized membrane protein YgcG
MASQVIENDIRPLVNSGDFGGAVKAFYDKSIQILSGELPIGYTTSASSSSSSDDSSQFRIVIVGFIIGMSLRSVFGKKTKKIKSKKVKNILKIGVPSLIAVLIFLFFIFSAAFVSTIIIFLIVGIVFGFLGLW